MKRRNWTRALSFLLVICLLLGMMPSAFAGSAAGQNVTFEEVLPDENTADLAMETGKPTQPSEEEPAEDEMVRVSIVLEKQATLERGYSTMGLASNGAAQSYRQTLLAEQQAVAARIAQATGEPLDTVWNLTLAANVISANVRYGDLDAVAATAGVRDVVLETRYMPCEAQTGTYHPNTSTSGPMTGADTAWNSGYTGAGSRIAVIDTGLDVDHQSLNAGAFHHALEENAAHAGMETQAYLDGLDLLSAQEIQERLPLLNIYKGYEDVTGSFIQDGSLTGDVLYQNEKIPFGYNYIDRDLDITHDNDTQGGHGSHVGGIAAANRYLANPDGTFSDALETVHVTGTAPDAQVLVMKVFGKNGGAYDSDYMAAIEDAIVLGCDSINLSLGSATAGMATDRFYQDILDSLTETDTLVVVSAGNNGAWAEMSYKGHLYADDVNLHTGGSPGTYANTLTVGSVENTGMVGASFRAAGKDIVYTEPTSNYNDPLISLDTSTDGSGTQWEYLFLDCLGKPEDYQGLDVTGKIVFVSRGETAFADKLTAAEDAGAAACVVYNNEPGLPLNMDLSTSSAYIPCVMIAQSDADLIREASTAVSTEGAVAAYSGEMTITGKVASEVFDSEFYTMSTFSSWGVPGDLSLKPEIIAPGGNIYSLNGATNKTDQYMLNSGTSMAALQVTGLAALLAQHMRETGIAEESGLSPRVLGQSLLMSTAEPMLQEESGLPYPVIQQGAGLANVAAALAADSYILVDGQPDGKVKAELGDDPDRTGQYAFTFTLHNLTDRAQAYALRTELFTQSTFEDYATEEQTQTARYMDYTLQSLAAEPTILAEGKEILPEAGRLTGCDFDGNGAVNESDGQVLLEYAIGKRDTLEHTENADLSGDGKVTAYDAELFLQRLGSRRVVLPAGGSVEISVTLRLTEAAKESLEEQFANGAYVEGYVYLDGMADEEGVIPVRHSIPVLAYYGGWDEPSMFDGYTYTQEAHGLNDHESYFYNPDNIFATKPVYNYVAMNDGQGTELYLGGNNFAEDEAYLPQRNAMRNAGGAYLSTLSCSLIRNAGEARASIANGDTGEVYYEELAGEPVAAAYYFPNYGAWSNLALSFTPSLTGGAGWYGVDADGEALPEGTRLVASLQAATEYELKADGTVDWSSLDQDATCLTIPFTIDNTAPTVSAVSVGTETDTATGEERKFFEVEVQDNQYTAAVLLLTPGGSKVVVRQAVNQDEAGARKTIRVDISEVFGSIFQLVVVDYAGNARYYDVTVGEIFDGPKSQLIGSTDEMYSLIDPNQQGAHWLNFTNDVNYDVDSGPGTRQCITAATYADGYVFYIATDFGSTTADKYLYVMDYPDFTQPILCGPISEQLQTLTYNPDDGNLYTLVDGTTLTAVDVADGALTPMGTLPDVYTYASIAYAQEAHCFYAVASLEDQVFLMKFEQPQVGDEAVLTAVCSLEAVNDTGIKLVLDEAQNAAYLMQNCGDEAELYTLELDTGTLTLTGRLGNTMSTIILPDDATAENRNFVRDQPTSISLNQNSVQLYINQISVLQAELAPWCLSDKSVVWTSSDEAVATVDENGQVIARQEGVTTITAASVLDSSYTASCTVAVFGNDFTISAVGTKPDGVSEMFLINLKDGTFSNQRSVTEADGTPISVEAATVDPTDGTVWVRDNAVDTNGEGYRIHSIDPATGVSSYDSEPNINNYQDTSLLITDIIYDEWNDVVLGVNGTRPMFMGEDLRANDLGSSWFPVIGEPTMKGVAITVGETTEQYGTKYSHVFVLDATNQEILDLELSYSSFMGIWSIYMNYYPLTSPLDFETDMNEIYQETLVYDRITKTPILMHHTKSGTEVYAMSIDKVNMNCTPCYLGTIEGYDNIAAYMVSYEGPVQCSIGADSKIEQAGQEFDIVATTSHNTAQAVGTVNAATAGEEEIEDGVVTVTIRADEAVGSGMAEIELGEGLTLQGLESPAALSAYTVEDGVIRFAYAHHAPLEADSVIAVLRLAYDGENTEVTVHETERSGKTVDVTTSVKISGACDGGEDCPSGACSDLDTGAWYHPYTDFVLESGLMQGVGGGRFSPNNSLTRGQLVTTLYRMAGEPEVEQTSSFTDLREGAYYADAVAWAQENGIAKGVTETRFAPEQSVTREQAAVFLHRFVTEYWEQAAVETADLTEFPDGGQVSLYARTAMAWAVGAGFLEGYEDGALRPTRVLTRVQMAKLLTLLADYI